MTNNSKRCDFTFSFHPGQRERFRNGQLVRDWRIRYSQLFDEDDERVLGTEHQRKYHFFEWLSAVLLYESTGYISLVEKYTALSHPHKRAKLQNFLPPNLFAWLASNESGQPDLFVFEPASGDWFFCEVKGPADSIRETQDKWATLFTNELTKEGVSTKGRIRVLCLRELDTV